MNARLAGRNGRAVRKSSEASYERRKRAGHEGRRSEDATRDQEYPEAVAQGRGNDTPAHPHKSTDGPFVQGECEQRQADVRDGRGEEDVAGGEEQRRERGGPDRAGRALQPTLEQAAEQHLLGEVAREREEEQRREQPGR